MLGQHAALCKSGQNLPCNFKITFALAYFVQNFLKTRMVFTVFMHVDRAPCKFQTNYKKIKNVESKVLGQV